MKASLIAFLLCGICLADEDNPKQVRVSIQYIEMAHPAMTELLDGGEKSGHAIHAKAMELVKTGEAKILDSSVVVCRSGQNAAAAGILEEIYPTEFENPYREIYGGNSGIAFPRPIDPFRRSMTAFETRNTGLTFQVEANVGDNPRLIDLRFSPEFVRRIRLDTWLEHSDQWGKVSFLTPVYERWGTEAWVTLSSGQFELSSVITPRTQAPPPAISRRVLLFVRADVLETPSPQ